MATRSTISFGWWLGSIGLCLLSSLCAIKPAHADSPPLNIVFILADDLGWTDMSGPNLGPHTSDYYETPNLNNLASQGMRFTNAYANVSCTPSRASLLTGRYAAALDLTAIEHGRATRQLLREPTLTYPLPFEEITIAERLKNAGYTTGLFGKWHLGHSTLAATHAAKQGFDTYVARTHVPKLGDWDHHRIEGLTDQATQFIEHNKDGPFFMMLSHKAVHTPLRTSPGLLTKYEFKPPGVNHYNPAYAGLVQQLDMSVGEVVAKIDELNLSDNTLVIFSSDNGGSETATANNPLRGGKGTLLEGGIRVPAIFRLPGVINAGTIADTPITLPDYTPTILDLAGVGQTSPSQLDGESLAPLLNSTGNLQRQSIFWHYPHYGRKGLTPVSAIRQGDWKLLEYFEDGSLELYNVTEDPGEYNNLATSLPDKATALHADLKQWQKQVDADIPTINPNWQASQYAGKLKWVWDGGDPGNLSETRWKTTIYPAKTKTKAWIVNGDGESGDGPTLVPISTHYRAFPSHAYSFDGVDDGMTFNSNFSASTTTDADDVTDEDDSAAFEIWFKMDQLQSDGQILFETGKTNRGLSMAIGNANAGDADSNADDLHLRVMGAGNDAILTVDLSQFTDPSRNFIQVVASVKDANHVSLYINGARFSQIEIPNVDLDWDSPGGAGIGVPRGTVGAIGGDNPPPFSIDAFDGQIATFRFYKQSLTDEQVLELYNYSLGPTSHHIFSTVGEVEVPEARPASIDAGDHEYDTIMLFHERQSTLTDDLHVDLLASAIAATISDDPTEGMEPGMIAEGTTINSYILHYDPLINPSELPVDATATIRFDDEILGIISTTNTLITSDFILGVIGKYSKAAGRGLELSSLDGITLFDNNHGVTVNLSVLGEDFDHLRLITGVFVVPLPTSWRMGLVLLIACAVSTKLRMRARY